MEKIDLKDRKILYHLDLNSRESFRSIGKKVSRLCEFMDDISRVFPKTIKNYTYFTIENTNKFFILK